MAAHSPSGSLSTGEDSLISRVREQGKKDRAEEEWSKYFFRALWVEPLKIHYTQITELPILNTCITFEYERLALYQPFSHYLIPMIFISSLLQMWNMSHTWIR